jgi:uncharacterized protein (DUF2267 family)
VTYDEFITIVEQHAGVGRERAERAGRAVLETLAERLSQGEARDLATQLPAEVAPWLHTDDDARGFHVDEFLRRVGGREEADLETAQKHARAVFTALSRAITDDEFADMVAELPKDFRPLLPRGEHIEVMPAELFWERVADRTGLDEDRARRATEAVLETLAERISSGEVADLISALPIQFHDALRRGDDLSHGVARKMSLDEFVRRVAEREAVTPEETREHARAVFATLREAVPDKEFFDVTAQLPDNYTVLLARP